MGKKRQIVQVDEDKLKMMMAGDIPIKADTENDVVIRHIHTDNDNHISDQNDELHFKEPVTKEVFDDENINFENESQETRKYTKRKKNKTSYAGQFLYKPEPSPRRQSSIHLNEDNYRNINLILKTTDNLSIANFINNVLTHHFEIYRSEVEETIKEYFKDLYKQ